MNPYLALWLAMLAACFPKTPEQRRSEFRVIQGGKAAA
jgi:hypothetical protein